MFKEDGNVIHFANPRGKPTPLTPRNPSAKLIPLSPRRRPLQHLRPLRQRRGEGTHRAGPRYPEPAGSRLPRFPAQARRELPEHAEGPGREEGR
jgi:hypothetical protein